MKTYFIEWYDKGFNEMTTLKINDKQRELIDFLLDKLGLEDILYQADVTINVTENESHIIDLT